MAALVYLVALAAIALLAPWIAPHDPNRQDLLRIFEGPTSDHWLGTDDLGRDLASRLIVASRISLRISFQVVGGAMLVAVPIGLIAGYFGGRIDNVLMRVVDALLSVPALVLALAVAGILGPGINNAAGALAFVFAPSFARLARAQTLAVRQETFIEASHSVGTRSRTIIVRHVLPNVASPIIVQASLALAGALLAEAALSFLGAGVQPPDASWGSMLRRGYDVIFTESWMMFIPGTAIAITVLAFNAVGDSLRDAMSVSSISSRRRDERRGITTVSRSKQAAVPIASPQDEGAALHERVTLPDTSSTARTNRPEPGSVTVGPVLRVAGLEVTVATPSGHVKLVEDVSFEIRAGETLGLVGESGSGKTVTSLAIARLLPSPPARITAGSVLLDGTEVLDLSFRELRQLRGPTVAMIFQDPMTSLNPAFTIGDQIGEAVRWHEPVTRRQARDRAAKLIDLVGVSTSRLDAYPHQLSGGMRQRVMIAMALVCSPRLLIADEPTTALDVTIQAQILELLRALQSELGMAMLFVTHDLGVVADICDRVAVIYAGQIVEQGTAEQLFTQPRHPYTDGLLNAMPQEGTRGDDLYVIPGQVPSPGAHGVGCRFANRCPYVTDACIDSAVPLTIGEQGRLSRCIFGGQLASRSDSAVRRHG